MTILAAYHCWHDHTGRAHRSGMPANAIKTVQDAISAYWSDPYSFLGFWKSVDPARSHPGRYYPDHRLEA